MYIDRCSDVRSCTSIDAQTYVAAISIAGGKKPDKLKQLTAQMTINSHDTTVDLSLMTIQSISMFMQRGM